MKSKALIFISLVLALSVFAQENSKGDEPLHANTYAGGIFGSGGGAYSTGISRSGVYGGGQICKWGCCGEAVGYNRGGGVYYNCNCCATFAEAKAYKLSQPKLAETKN